MSDAIAVAAVRHTEPDDVVLSVLPLFHIYGMTHSLNISIYQGMIIRGAYNVYPREVEEVLYTHEAVFEAAVFGIPHDDLGEEIAAVIVLKPGAKSTADELRQYVKSQVAPYNYPRVIKFAKELPKTAAGKILKRAISMDE